MEEKYTKKLQTISFSELQNLYQYYDNIDKQFAEFCNNITNLSNQIINCCENHQLTHTEYIILSNATTKISELQLLDPTDEILNRITAYHEIITTLNTKTIYTLPNKMNGNMIDIIIKYANTLSIIKSNNTIDQKIGFNRQKLIDKEMERRLKINYINNCITYINKEGISVTNIIINNDDTIISYAHIIHYTSIGRNNGCRTCLSVNFNVVLKESIKGYYRSNWQDRYTDKDYYSSKTKILEYNNGNFDINTIQCDNYCRY